MPGVPRVGDKETSDKSDTVQTQASQTSQAFVHGRRLEVIPSKRASGTVLVRCKVEEEDVLATAVVEVVVLPRSRVAGEVLVISATVEVYVSFLERYLTNPTSSG